MLRGYAVSGHNLHGLRCSFSLNTSISVGNYYRFHKICYLVERYKKAWYTLHSVGLLFHFFQNLKLRYFQNPLIWQYVLGTCKMRNEIETKRNRSKRNASKRNELYRNETKSKRNEINRSEIDRNETKRNNTRWKKLILIKN